MCATAEGAISPCGFRALAKDELVCPPARMRAAAAAPAAAPAAGAAALRGDVPEMGAGGLHARLAIERKQEAG